jgi:hypothetical protein
MSKQTKPLTQFNQVNVRAILEECREALEPVAEKYGLTLDRKGRTYQHDSLPVMFQLLVKQMTEDGTVLTAAAKEFQRYAPMYGFDKDDLGKTFTTHQGSYRISGWKPRSRKYPILGECVRSGKTFKFMVEQVKAGLKKAA